MDKKKSDSVFKKYLNRKTLESENEPESVFLIVTFLRGEDLKNWRKKKVFTHVPLYVAVLCVSTLAVWLLHQSCLLFF